jgi:hypothetical protein
LKLPRCIFTVAERKQWKAVISFVEWNWKSCSAALQFRTSFERLFSFLSHVHLRPFSFILNPKAVKCLHTFEIQNTANVVAMVETAICDYSSVRMCLNANIHTFLFLNRWCKAKKTSLIRGKGIPIHKHSTTGSTF